MADPRDTLPYPASSRTRKEWILGAILGLNELPDYPISSMTREERLLYEIALNGGGSSLTVVEELPTGSEISGSSLYKLTKNSSQGGKIYTKGLYYWDESTSEWIGVSGGGGSSTSQIMIELTGDSGYVTDDEINLITDDTVNTIIINGDEIYRLFEVNTTYFTFTNIDTVSTTEVEYKSIYVNVNESAVNYKSWTKETTAPQTEVTAEVLSELIEGEDDIRVDLSSDNSTLIVGTHAKTVTITDVPPTATSGTLTEEQLAALEESTKSVIVFNNEIYTLNDNGHEAGTRGYSHSGVENSVFMLKNITVTLNTRGWVLTTQEVDIPELLGTTGQSTTKGMSQKAITDALAEAGGIKVLTTDDYNWPETGTKTSIALWKLDAGVYLFDNVPSEKVYPAYSSTISGGTYNAPMVIISDIKDVWSVQGKSILVFNNHVNGNPPKMNSLELYAVNLSGRPLEDTGSAVKVLTERSIVNDLTSTTYGMALDSRQGKVLKDLIDSLVIKGTGAPTTSTVGTVGKLYEDTTNGKLYQCTAVSGSTYTWTEVGGGGVNVVQTTGQSTTDVMSQKAVTDIIGDVETILTTLTTGTGA